LFSDLGAQAGIASSLQVKTGGQRGHKTASGSVLTEADEAQLKGLVHFCLCVEMLPESKPRYCYASGDLTHHSNVIIVSQWQGNMDCLQGLYRESNINS